MELQQYSGMVKALSIILWKIAHSIFFVIIILSPLKIFCCKKKKGQGQNTAQANGEIPVPNQPGAEGVPGALAAANAANPAGTLNNTQNAGATGAKNYEKRKEDQTQIDDIDESDKDNPDIVPMERVKKMGNIDVVIKEKKTQMEKEIEEIKSTHEMDNKKSAKADPALHVKINEKRCKLYETNDEPTLDDEVEDQLI